MKELGERSESDAYDIRSQYWLNAKLAGSGVRCHANREQVHPPLLGSDAGWG